MTNAIWSYDGEVFQYENLGELLDNYVNVIDIGDVVYVADAYTPDVRRYVDAHAVVENMQERYYDDCGEECDAWPDLSNNSMNTLARVIAEFIEAHDPPKFWVVRGVKEYVITAEDLG